MNGRSTLRIALAQSQAVVGDIDGNIQRAYAAYSDACAQGASLVVLPELFVCGYPPEDLLFQPMFLEAIDQGIAKLAAKVGEVPLILGAPNSGGAEEALHNSALWLQDGACRDVHHKVHLPNYGVFDERRYFAPGSAGKLVEQDQVYIGLTVCEDLWVQDGALAKAMDAEVPNLILNLSASPFHRGKAAARIDTFRHWARRHGSYVAFCNLVGSQDELVFDGRSFVISPSGEVVATAAAFEEDLLLVDLDVSSRSSALGAAPTSDSGADSSASLTVEQELCGAIELGLKGYMQKSGFRSVVVGLSGGIDSALVAALAVRALGPENVHCISMPSRYNSDATKSDARTLAADLGVHFREISIEKLVGATHTSLQDHVGERLKDLTEQNIQARLRGHILMTLSNEEGHLLLATGNKSELAVGYATLYGDMAGGFAPIKDLTKQWVYKLTRWLQMEGAMPIPEGILTRPPSAELRDDQTDQDALPPYDVLDAIIEGYVEQNLTIQALEAQGISGVLIREVVRLIHRNEYKRYQATLGPKLTARSFGRDWRIPIAHAWDLS